MVDTVGSKLTALMGVPVQVLVSVPVNSNEKLVCSGGVIGSRARPRTWWEESRASSNLALSTNSRFPWFESKRRAYFINVGAIS
jgi:hypothetical protein